MAALFEGVAELFGLASKASEAAEVTETAEVASGATKTTLGSKTATVLESEKLGGKGLSEPLLKRPIPAEKLVKLQQKVQSRQMREVLQGLKPSVGQSAEAQSNRALFREYQATVTDKKAVPFKQFKANKLGQVGPRSGVIHRLSGKPAAEHVKDYVSTRTKGLGTGAQWFVNKTTEDLSTNVENVYDAARFGKARPPPKPGAVPGGQGPVEMLTGKPLHTQVAEAPETIAKVGNKLKRGAIIGGAVVGGTVVAGAGAYGAGKAGVNKLLGSK